MQRNEFSNPPEWVTDAVFYQIFPERFENGDSSNDPPNVEAWGNTPKPGNYFGGDLQGIINRLSYLKELGVNAIYLNPIFSAESNHKYNTKDYLTIDSAFGTNDLFETLLQKCHAENIRVVIDGVFNHVGTAHFAFQDVLKNGRDSKYVYWFNIYSFPVRMRPKPNYECWWGYASLPKLMTQNSEVKKHIFEVTEYWTKKGIDGWRLDVANEVPHEFWKEWRQLVKSINKDCYIVGELWQDASVWLQGDEFDATMNYKFRDACLRFFAEKRSSAKEFGKELMEIRALYKDENNFAMQNLLGSHDTERYLTMCGGDVWKVKLSYLFQMTYFGAPMMYYGDEIGMEGGKDPDCRRTMIWNRSEWNSDLFEFVKNLIALRNSSDALRRGDFAVLPNNNENDVFIFQRSYQNQIAIIAINRARTKKEIAISVEGNSKNAVEHFSGEKISILKRTIFVTIPGRSGKIFFATRKDYQ